MRRLILIAALFGVLGGNLITVAADDSHPAQTTRLPGLQASVQVIRETNDIPHIRAHNQHDLLFVEGYLHAQDRFFEMDYNRHLASGTLAELLGAAAVPTDVQFRTFGLRRGAEASLLALSPGASKALDAYVNGVNAYANSHPLPPEYQALHLTKVDPWTAVDTLTLAKLLFFGLSFDLSDIDNTVALKTYQGVGAVAGFDGTKLFFQDVFRSAPFDPASTVPDASIPAAGTAPGENQGESNVQLGAGPAQGSSTGADDHGVSIARQYLDGIKDLPEVNRFLNPSEHASSNEWAISGGLTTTGLPFVANDPHLSLGTPPIWYPIQLEGGGINVIGHSFAGLPYLALGHNRRIAWGATVNPVDVTDVFQEQIAPDAQSPSGLAIVHTGQLEPIIPIPEAYRVNALNGTPDAIVPAPAGSTPPVVLIVPRRNNGPIISLDQVHGTALSVQYTGFGATKELEGIIGIDMARNLNDFKAALQFMATGSFNWAYGDTNGNIAYITSGEVPIREDLQAGAVNGLPPFFIRNGTGGNEWLPVQHPHPNQVVPFEILPAEEMPHIINPPAGWFANSNNDPVGVTLNNNPLGRMRPGGGIYYLSPGYDGFRAGRSTALIRQLVAHGKVSPQDMEAMQADTVMIDSTVFVPLIAQAFSDAKATGANPALVALGSNPAVAAAVDKIAHWDLRTRTGIASGYDVGRPVGSPPSAQDVTDGVATTIYSEWRSQFVRNTIDAPLNSLHLPTPPGGIALADVRHLLDTLSTNGGVGASGINFLNVPGVASPADRRDIVILSSLATALTRLASADFAPAFGGSTNLNDYLWGKLHRIVFAHPLGGPFNIPPAGGAVANSTPGLPGIATDGGFEVLDRSDSDVRADSVNAFMFTAGPSNRSVHVASEDGMTGESALPGGVSGVLGSPFYTNLLSSWLANQYYPLINIGEDEMEQNVMSVTRLLPPGKDN
jgi:penicillin G amidase